MFNFNFGNFGASSRISLLQFVTSGNDSLPFNFTFNTSNQKMLYLLDPQNKFDVFKFLPSTFKITTNSGSSNFNIQMLQDTSSIIYNFIENNPNKQEYHLNITDDKNVLGKFEQLYHGKSVIFEDSELPICREITSLLNIVAVPGFMKQDQMNTGFQFSFPTNESPQSKVEINKSSVEQFIVNSSYFPQSFTIKTNKNEYKCNHIGIHSSNVISNFLQKNPNSDVYIFDYEDEFGEFESICNFFNFANVAITPNNMDAIKEISDELQIDLISKETDTFVDKLDKFQQKIEDQQEIIDKINELFELLYDIKQKTVQNVKNTIIESDWVKTEEDVQELAAFMLQVISSGLSLHNEMADLIVQLNEESDDSNYLKILAPFIVKKLMNSFCFTIQNCSFIYQLLKRGIIDKEEFKKKINNCILIAPNHQTLGFQFGMTQQQPTQAILCQISDNVFYWFLPEVIEIKEIKDKKTFFSNGSKGPSYESFINTYFDKIEEYKKMRDSGEPKDELTLAIRHDDVDKLQKIITSNSNSNDVSGKRIPFNIFESFILNGETKYLNYAAAYGSIKCFKYLLLNYDQVDDQSFNCAIYGNNLEIIKIVDQKLNEEAKKNQSSSDIINNTNTNGNNTTSFSFNFSTVPLNQSQLPIISSISGHKNNLFDWLLDKITTKGSIDEILFTDYVRVSLAAGNAHSIIELFEKYFNLTQKLINNQLPMSYNGIVELPSKNGFYLLSKLLIYFFDDLKEPTDSLVFDNKASCTACGFSNNDNSTYSGVDITNTFNNTIFSTATFVTSTVPNFSSEKNYTLSFGNLSIFKLFVPRIKQTEIEDLLPFAILNDYMKIVRYFFDSLVKEKKFLVTNTLIYRLICASFSKNSDVFNYLLEKIKSTSPDAFNNFEWKTDILGLACSAGNVHASKTITDLILEKKGSEIYFTDPFISAILKGSIEICQFFIDKKVDINFNQIVSRCSDFGFIKPEIFSLIINNSTSEVKKQLYSNLIIPAVLSHNAPIVEEILKETTENTRTLLEAVNANDPKIVKIILKYNKKPLFVNKKTQNGTALIIATQKGSLEIVNDLLAVPGIDPNLFDTNKDTALIIASNNLNLDILNAILDFYGDNIQYQKWQLDSLARKTLNQLNSGEWKSNQNVKKFINRVLEIKCIDPNLYDNNYSFLIFACESNEIEIVKKLLKLEYIDVNLYSTSTGNSPLMIAIQNKNEEIAELLINYPKTNINFRNYEDQTALTIAVANKMNNIIDLLLNHERFNAEESRINYAFSISSSKVANQLVKSKHLDINDTIKIDSQMTVSGFGPSDFNNTNTTETPLMFAIKNNNRKLVDLIINHPSFDKKRSKIYDAILIVAEKNELKIFKKLLELIDNDFGDHIYKGNGILSMATFNFSMKNQSDINFPNFNVNFIQPNINLNQPNFNFIQPNININQPNFNFIQPNINIIQPNININQPNFNFGINQATTMLPVVSNDDEEENDDDNHDKENDDGKDSIFEIILESAKFEISNRDMNMSIYNLLCDCICSNSDDSFNALTKLVEYDKKHNNFIDLNRKNLDSSTYLTNTFLMNNTSLYFNKIFDFLLDNGADPNLSNSLGVYPLEFAIDCNLYIYAHALIETNKIDMTKRILVKNQQNNNCLPFGTSFTFGPIDPNSAPNPNVKNYTTYLHLAAKKGCEQIFKEIYETKQIDINETDDLGNTPLIEACKNMSEEDIQLLFKEDDLDYKHCNNEGKDALQIVRSQSPIMFSFNKDDPTMSKDEYLAKLLSYFNNNANTTSGFNLNFNLNAGATSNTGFGSFSFNPTNMSQTNPNDDKSNNENSSDNKTETISEKSEDNSSASQSSPTNAFGSTNQLTTSPFSFGNLNSTTSNNSTETPTNTFGSTNQQTTSPFSFGNLNSLAPNFGTNKQSSVPSNKPKNQLALSEATEFSFVLNDQSNPNNFKWSFSQKNSEPRRVGASISHDNKKYQYQHSSLSSSRKSDGVQREIEEVVHNILEDVPQKKVDVISKSLSRMAEKYAKGFAAEYINDDDYVNDDDNEEMVLSSYNDIQSEIAQKQMNQMIQMNLATQKQYHKQLKAQDDFIQSMKNSTSSKHHKSKRSHRKNAK